MRALLIFAWLASCIVAFQFGKGGNSKPSGEPVPQNPEPNLRKSAIAANSKGQFNDTQRLGTENRFVAFTKELGGDTLARLLPEMTEKMDEEQVREVLRRVIDEVEPGPSRMTAQFELIGRWAQLDPDTAFDYIDAMTDPKMRHDVKRKAIETWAATDPGAALEYLDSAKELPAAPMEAFWSGIGTSRDVRIALQFVPELLGDTNDRGVSKALRALYQNDDKAVTLWAQNLPEGGLRDQAILGIAEEWALHDAEAAKTWVAKYAAPSNLDLALERVAASSATALDPKGVRKPVIADP